MAICLYLIYIFLICSCVINRQSMSFFRPPLCTSDYIDLFIHRSLIMLPPLVLLSLYVYVYLNRRRNLISTVVIVLLFHHTQRQYLSNIPSNKFYSSFFFLPKSQNIRGQLNLNLWRLRPPRGVQITTPLFISYNV